jgi:hypothetical protein
MSPVPGRLARRKTVRVAATLGMTALPVVAGVAGAAPAMAGTNGQEIEICGLGPHSLGRITGSNQTGHHASAPWKDGFGNECQKWSGYWWRGSVSIWHKLEGSPSTTFPWVIPAYLGSTNWVTCYVSRSFCNHGHSPY